MLPEPTLPKRPAPAPPPLEVMTPLFALPGGGEPDLGRPSRRRAARPPGRGRRDSVRLAAGYADHDVPVPARRGGRGAAVPGDGRDTPVPGDGDGCGAAVRAGRADRDVAGEPGSAHAELLAVTAPRLRRALARSFLRYGVPGDPERAVHAAMNVVEPVLEARDTEILRLRDLIAATSPRRVVSRARA
jgi:hypothetical protein